MPLRSFLPLLLAALVWLCAVPDWAQATDGEEGADSAVDAAAGRIVIAMAQEPPTLNSMMATDQVSSFVLGHINEGLLRYDARQRLVAGVASDWTLTATGARFTLRPDARWSDGQPVVAADFIHAWRTVVDPATASEYAFILYPIKNAEAINAGQAPVESLGVSAPDPHTLIVTFERPCGYFLSLTAFTTYFPVRADFHRARGERYAADAAELLSNGPFRLTEWIHGASLRLTRSETYWNREAIRIREIDAPFFTTDPTTRFNLFRDGKIALTGLDSETMRAALARRDRIQGFADGSVFFLEFNHRSDRPTRNLNLRRALRLVYDPEELVNRVIGVPGVIPAWSIFPMWLRGAEGYFREEHPAEPIPVDLERARALFEQARQELGVAQIGPLVLLTGDSPTASRQAEYLQQLFTQTLGLDLRIDRQTFKQRLAKMSAGDFDLVASGWGPDFDDPITFGDLFASWNQNNRGRYENPAYDHWVDVARDSADPDERMEAFAQLQEIVRDDVVILPQYERGQIYVVHPRLRGVVRRLFGADPDFTHAWITPAETE